MFGLVRRHWLHSRTLAQAGGLSPQAADALTYPRVVRTSFIAIITLFAIIAVVAVVQSDWLIALVFVAMAAAFARLQTLARRPRR